MKVVSSELRKKLREAVRRNSAEGLLFSGGLDTSILAVLNPNMKAITVSLESFGEDISYAGLVAKNLKLKHYHRRVSIDEAIDSIPDVIRILKSFDPAIPNDLVVYFGLKLAKGMGMEEIMTGDGSDELFAGYDFMNPARASTSGVKDIENLDKYIKKISSSLQFSSNELGSFFNIKVKQPFLDKEFIDFSLKIPVELKIKEENGNLWGKWILRKAFKKMLPAKIIWQDKRPLEYGSGMRKLREIITSKIPDEEFEHKNRRYPVKFMNKEHLYYYEIYKKEVGEITEPKNNQKTCPGCGAGMNLNSFHCQICGNVLDWRM